MRAVVALALAFVPTLVFAQTKDVVDAVDAKLATLKFAYALQDPATGGFRVDAKGPPSLRACNGAVKAIRALGATVPNEDKVKAFVMNCYDAKTGTFAEPGGAPDVTITSIGVMIAIELGIPKDQYRRAMDYLAVSAKSFEDVRIAAAAVEAWGVKDCPFKLDPWFDIAMTHAMNDLGDPKDGGARESGSVAAMFLRLGKALPPKNAVADVLREGHREDGGWGKKGAAASDLESTYRVMRAFALMKEKPKDEAGVRKLLAACRNADGGYGVAVGQPSTMSGVYYAAIIGKWLDSK